VLAAAAAVVALLAAAPAGAATTEIDLRDYLYTFSVPAGALGPWHVVKLDATRVSARSRFIARFVTGNRDDPGHPSHGEYMRVEDTQSLSSCVDVVGGAGVGAGYQPQSTLTAEVSAKPGARSPVSFAVGLELSTLTPAEFQRIVALGPAFSSGNFFGYARYYRPSLTGQPFDVPPSGAFDLGVHATPRLDVTGVFNVGGEIGGDRTASQLPTSSGRYGPDAGAGVRYAVTQRFGMNLLFERAWYRQAPTGAYARTQTVLSAGVFVRGTSE